MTNKTFARLCDRELLDRIARAASDNRSSVVELLQLLGEIDTRRLYLPEGCASLFAYCTQVLRFSEHEAYHRIEGARAVRDFPVLLDHLRSGALTLTSVTLLRPHLTAENVDGLIAAALNKSKRDVEQLVATLAPRPDVKPIVRRLPVLSPSATDPVMAKATEATETLIQKEKVAPLPSPRPVSMPLSSDRYLLRVTLSATAHTKLRRAQDLMHHSDPAEVIDRALSLLVDDLERRICGQVKKPRTSAESNAADTRYVPAAVRREVWKRDGGRCAFVGGRGRCAETGNLEFHHVEPFALGGPTTAQNLELRCRAHNQYEGRILFGSPSAVDRPMTDG